MSSFRTISPTDTTSAVFHSYLLGVVAPRPIAFASTVDSQGKVNLSPFSFFNVFGSNPPILIFSPSRRVRDNTIKHTLENVQEVKEVVINIVNYAMVQQMSLASCEYEKGVNEFIKAGFSEEPSILVKPPRVKEAPAAFECRVNQIIATGTEGGAGNLVICEILLAHIQEDIINAKNQIDPQKLDAVARMGNDWYCRAYGDAIFSVPKPNQKKGIGFDNIPAQIRYSTVLTGNDLGMLGNIEALPTKEEISEFTSQSAIQEIVTNKHNSLAVKEALHQIAKAYLLEGKVKEAWLTLLQEGK
ncbi:flavin reductase family protein [Rhodocytophaga rosea]|uniref:Flavin reductase family protein n=1 Tax=Rhodocytophaga rosea TaxID=2704465 RepID=A0A6C0GJ52_9BACT|nr:flavin reductase family protein [Rhodocytophaga rosea]QHT67740.1 flavin reductase family protein [Rhodocytophaga rosea]